MESDQSRGLLKLALILALLGQGASEMMMDFEMCGTWIHGTSGNIWFDVSKGCDNVTVAANETTLSIQGRIMGTCENSSTIPLTLGEKESQFCVYWEPLLDLLQVEVGGRNHTLCKTAALQQSCCSSLSRKGNANASGTFGILQGNIKGDPLNKRLQESYTFYGAVEDCYEDLCAEHRAQLIEQLALRSGVIGQVDLPCGHVSTKKLEEGFQGLNVDIQAPEKKPLRNEPPVSVWLPPSLVPREEGGATVVFTYYAENTLFQGPEDRILNGVVGISVENRVIANLPDPVKIVFHHGPVAKNESTKCVFWDTKKDPTKVTWRDEGCNTIRRQEETECRCDHLTYFAILVELNPGSPVDDLEALTYITSVCCAISLCSCVALIILQTTALRKERKEGKKKSSIPIHRNLAVALLLLCTLFVLTGVLANVASEGVCRAVGAALHYALLCSFAWMAIEVFTAFWLTRKVMDDLPRLRVLNALGFGLPALLVVVFVCINDVYGTRAITPSDDVSSPYKMCWIKDTWRGTLIHFITNVSFSVVVVLAGLVMLSLVLQQVQLRREWGRKRVTFLSIWGLSCLFGCTWGLGLLLLGPSSQVITFLFCIINSLQGFLLLVRYFLLEWIKKRKSARSSISTGSTVEPILPLGSKTQDQGPN